MAAWAMGNMSPKRAPAPLLALLSDPDVNVRNTAAWALYNIEDETSLPAIERALRVETDRDVQRSMVRALAVMGGASGQKAVVGAASAQRICLANLRRERQVHGPDIVGVD